MLYTVLKKCIYKIISHRFERHTVTKTIVLRCYITVIMKKSSHTFLLHTGWGRPLYRDRTEFYRNLDSTATPLFVHTESRKLSSTLWNTPKWQVRGGGFGLGIISNTKVGRVIPSWKGLNTRSRPLTISVKIILKYFHPYFQGTYPKK